jgi:hypothetical protein
MSTRCRLMLKLRIASEGHFIGERLINVSTSFSVKRETGQEREMNIIEIV